MQWVKVRWSGKMPRHSATNRNTWQILNTLGEEQPTEKLDWPIFCGSRENREDKKKKKLDMVRVKWLSGSRTLSIEFHASWTHFTRQHRAKNSFPFRPALKTYYFVLCFFLFLITLRRGKENVYFIVVVPNSHTELC